MSINGIFPASKSENMGTSCRGSSPSFQRSSQQGANPEGGRNIYLSSGTFKKLNDPGLNARSSFEWRSRSGSFLPSSISAIIARPRSTSKGAAEE